MSAVPPQTLIWHLRYGSNVDMTRFWRPPPYQLSYEGIRSLRSGSNRRPPEPKSGALPSCATERFKTMAHTRDYDTPTSCVTGKRSSSELRVRIWCSVEDSNFQPYACRASALPLRQPSNSGGNSWNRTKDTLLFRQVLLPTELSSHW